MEDKITFANVVTLFMNNNILGRPVADELGATDLGDMLSNYRVAKSLRSLRAAYQEYNEQRNKIIETIGEEDEQGNKRIDPRASGDRTRGFEDLSSGRGQDQSERRNQADRL